MSWSGGASGQSWWNAGDNVKNGREKEAASWSDKEWWAHSTDFTASSPSMPSAAHGSKQSSWSDCAWRGRGVSGSAANGSSSPSSPQTRAEATAWTKSSRWKCFDFKHGGVCLHSHLRLPRIEFAAGAAIPLLLFLHSASYDPVNDLFPNGDAWLDRQLEPMFVLCPQCPEDYYWLIRGNSWTEEGGEWTVDEEGYCLWEGPAADEMAEALVGLLRQVAKDVPVDPRRVFLTGCSMGGHGCWDLAVRRPSLFSALAPVASHFEKSRVVLAEERLYGMPTWAIHGVGDFCCNFDEAQELVRRLGRKAGLTAYYEGKDGQSVHNSASLVAYGDYGPALVRWLLRQPARGDLAAAPP